MVHSRVKKQKEVGANFDGSPCCFCLIHHFRRRNAAASIRDWPITLLQDEHRSNFPPDISGVNAGVVHDMAVVWCWYEDRSAWNGCKAKRIQRYRQID